MAGGGGSGGVSGDGGGDGAVHMNGVLVHAAAGKICAVGDGSVVVAVEVVVVVAAAAAAAAAAAVGTCPGTGSLAGDSGGKWCGNPAVAVEFPACAAGNATTVHAEDRYGEGQEVLQAEMGSMGNPH